MLDEFIYWFTALSCSDRWDSDTGYATAPQLHCSHLLNYKWDNGIIESLIRYQLVFSFLRHMCRPEKGRIVVITRIATQNDIAKLQSHNLPPPALGNRIKPYREPAVEESLGLPGKGRGH